MRGRKSGLLPLELTIVETAIEMRREGCAEFYGFLAAARMRDADEAKLLTSRGTLYKALNRLERQGFLSSRWEAPEIALSEGRPRRRLYQVAPTGEVAAREAQRPAGVMAPRPQPGGSPS
jgi:hypothetical protein